MVDAKSDEELAEYHKNPNPEEWANPVQVIYTAAEVREFTVGQLEQIHLWKKAQRGAFRKKLPLMEIRGFRNLFLRESEHAAIILLNKDREEICYENSGCE